MISDLVGCLSGTDYDNVSSIVTRTIILVVVFLRSAEYNRA